MQPKQWYYLFAHGFHGFILIGFTEIKYFEDLQNNTLRSSYCDVTTCGAYSVISVVIKKYFSSDICSAFKGLTRNSSHFYFESINSYVEISTRCLHVSN